MNPELIPAQERYLAESAKADDAYRPAKGSVTYITRLQQANAMWHYEQFMFKVRQSKMSGVQRLKK